MKNLIAQITKEIQTVKDCKFAAFEYLTKKHNELARYTVLLGFSYHNLVVKSVLELKLLIRENKSKWNDLERLAAARVMKSLRKTLRAHARGEQNEDYTKKDQYIPIGAGLSVNTTDNTIQLFGLLQTKKTIREGVYPVVNSAPLTIAQNKLKKSLPISHFREFALDLSQVVSVKVNGEVFEIEYNTR